MNIVNLRKMKWKNLWKKDRKLIAISFMIGIIITMIFGVWTNRYAEGIHASLQKEVIRFHVVANSDKAEDQLLKQHVRDAVLKKMEPILQNAHGIKQSRKIIKENMSDVKKIAEQVIKQWGKEYPVAIALDTAMFPTKQYGDIVFPTGEYEALRIIIGEGKGKNWWCVMFPPLCFVDITHGVVPQEQKKELKNVLGKEEYNIVTQAKSTDDVPIKIKFKLIEWWESRKGEPNYHLVKQP